jgi:hypothetical protein
MVRMVLDTAYCRRPGYSLYTWWTSYAPTATVQSPSASPFAAMSACIGASHVADARLPGTWGPEVRQRQLDGAEGLMREGSAYIHPPLSAASMAGNVVDRRALGVVRLHPARAFAYRAFFRRHLCLLHGAYCNSTTPTDGGSGAARLRGSP